MKSIILSFVFLLGTYFAFAQKYAYIDSDYILENVPEYKEAKEKLDKLADRWTKEIEERYAVLKTKKDNIYGLNVYVDPNLNKYIGINLAWKIKLKK
jgi:outer membrane protein